MDVEEEMAVYSETVFWVECDLCGSVYGDR
jgi:ribosomal protein S27E